MTDYQPGPAHGVQIEKDGDTWSLVLVRDLRHAPEKVWMAITDPAHLRYWAPFDATGTLATPGATVQLTTVGAPGPHITDATVTRADAPRLLEYNWGDHPMRWQLSEREPASRSGPGSTAASSPWGPLVGMSVSMCSITSWPAPPSGASPAPKS